jgi:hypothetical protein
MKYYMARVQFETINEQNGRAQKTKENYLVEALNVSDVEDKLKDKFQEGMAEFSVIKVDESNIMGIIK